MQSPPPAQPTPDASGAGPSAPPPGSRGARIGIYAVILLAAGLGAGISLRWVLAGGIPNTPAPIESILQITTDPGQATLIVDGKIFGQTPAAAFPLPVGPHSLRIEKDGFQPLVRALNLTPGSQILQLKLAPVEYARLEVNSTPSGAEVLVDGAFRGVTPLVVTGLDPGIHDLTVQKVNFTTDQSRHNLRAGEVKRVTDITLGNKLLLMLKANLEINPRSINNNLDMAHFFYVNNDMPRSVHFYMRARELAALPMPVPPPDTPADELAFLPQLFQDEIRRVNTEEDHHYVNYHEYYGTGLDFDTFKRLYAEGVEQSKIWKDGIHSIAWVVEQVNKLDAPAAPAAAPALPSATPPATPPAVAPADGINGPAVLRAARDERTYELFGDFLSLRTDCGPALAGLTAANLHLGHVAEARELYERAKTQLAKADIPAEDQPFVAPAWLWMGQAWSQVARKAAGPLQKDALTYAGESLQKAVAVSGKDRFTLADAEYHSGLLARDRGLKEESAAQFLSAHEVIKELIGNSQANADSLARCKAMQAPIEYALAYADLDANKRDEAIALFRDLVTVAPETSPYHSAAKKALELLDSGHTPVDSLPR